MMGRFLLLVVIVGGVYFLWQYKEDVPVWMKEGKEELQVFLKKDVESQKAELQEKTQDLQKKLGDLTASLEEKKEAGEVKAKEIWANLQDTQEALEETYQSLQVLQNSVRGGATGGGSTGGQTGNGSSLSSAATIEARGGFVPGQVLYYQPASSVSETTPSVPPVGSSETEWTTSDGREFQCEER